MKNQQILQSMLDNASKLPKEIAMNPIQAVLSAQKGNSPNRRDFQAVVLGQMYIMHPQGQVVQIDGRNFKATDGLPTNFNDPGMPFFLTLKGKMNGRDGFVKFVCAEGQVYLDRAFGEKYSDEAEPAGIYTLQALETCKISVDETVEIGGVETSSTREAVVPCINGVWAFGFRYLLMLNLTAPAPMTLSGVIYNCSNWTNTKNRKQFRQALALWEKLTPEQRELAQAKGQAPRLNPECYLLNPTKLDLIPTGNTRFRGGFVNEPVSEAPEATAQGTDDIVDETVEFGF